jgi:glucose/arabinose dehydrogenase
MTMRRLVPVLIAVWCLSIPASAGAARLIDVGDFNQPLFLAAPPGDDTRLMVVEKEGAIQVLRGGAQSLFLDVDAAVGGIATGGEQGLLSMAFAPDYASSGRFYVYYTAADGLSNRIDEFRVSGDPSQADPGSRRQVIAVPHPNPQTNHNGGQVAFGPDGLLYMAPGDGAANANSAQDASSLLGKVLRINPNPSGANCPATATDCYGIPAGNPLTGADPGRDEIFHMGLRNPFRFSFDRATGDLLIGDVGAGTLEEVTLVPSGTAAGRNFGWPICEGDSCNGAPPANHLGPALRYSQTSPRAVTGGVVVRDPDLPEAFGRYVYADFYEGVIRVTNLSPAAAAGHGAPLGPTASNLASFSEDNGQCVYITSLDSGNVFRLAADSGPAPVPCATRAAQAGLPPGAGPSQNQDTTPPALAVEVKRRQRVLRNRGAIGYGRCNEACTVQMTARLRIGRLAYPLRTALRNGRAGRRVRLRAALTRRSRRALRRALARRRRAVVVVALSATDPAGNTSRRVRFRIRVVRRAPRAAAR